jgi:hypothetical protein
MTAAASLGAGGQSNPTDVGHRTEFLSLRYLCWLPLFHGLVTRGKFFYPGLACIVLILCLDFLLVCAYDDGICEGGWAGGYPLQISGFKLDFSVLSVLASTL